MTTDNNDNQINSAAQPERMCLQCGVYKPATYEYFRAFKGGKLHPDSICRECVVLNQKNYDREYGRKHGRERAARMRAWAKNNPVFNVKSANDRAIANGLPGTLTSDQWVACLAYWGNRCAVCKAEPDGNIMLAMDHWIAIKDKRPNNPGTVAENILPLCHTRIAEHPACNNSKHASDPVEWLIWKFGKDQTNNILADINNYFKMYKAGLIYRIPDPKPTIKRLSVQLDLFSMLF